MSFLELAEKRYSVRSFQDRPVEKEKIEEILEAGRVAPSAVNFQPLRFVVVTDPAVKSKVAETYSRDWFKKAPVVIIVCGDHTTSWKRKDGKDHCDIDAAIAADHMILAATDLGLGTCWVCAFDAQKCHQILGLPDAIEPIVMIPMGYASDSKVPERKRKSKEEIVSWEGFKL